MNIKVNNLTKKYGDQTAIDGVTFEVNTGEIVGFLGPNGAGKTTTMKIITNFIAPTSGEVFIGGMLLNENVQLLKKHIGYLPENNPLYEEMPIIDYLKFIAGLQNIPEREIFTKIRNIVKKVGLNDEKHKKIGELSKGYKQRVGLAQALIHDPDILILDEPTSGLDPNQIVEIRKLIRELGREKTVILSTHILPEVEAIADRILIINKGKIVANGSADTLRSQAEDSEVLIITVEEGNSNDIYTAIQNLPTVALVDFASRQSNRFQVKSYPKVSSKRDIFNLCVQNHWILTEMTPIERKLEDIFRQLTLN
ncbi:MAG TPA: ATP-binding cassette domain-containing protein [Bacteroidales bacterium]|nr:ATP-binding cassette domain-containing protein [Bacteroidales bacterium]